MKNIKNLKPLMFPAIAIICIGGAANAHDHSGGEKRRGDITQNYQLSGFDALELGGVFELDVRVGGDFNIVMSGPAKEMDSLIVEVKHGALVVKRKKGKHHSRGKRDSVNLTITLPSLDEVDIGGVVSGSIAGIKSDSFELNVGGVADLELNGTCTDLDIAIGGVGDVNAEGLVCEDVDAALGGVGNVSVYASNSVDAAIGGVGEIDVYGKPKHVEKTKGFLSHVNIH
ncbi:MAG: head GIN domain-containing protein [Robiginitomaculum sp.]